MHRFQWDAAHHNHVCYLFDGYSPSHIRNQTQTQGQSQRSHPHLEINANRADRLIWCYIHHIPRLFANRHMSPLSPAVQILPTEGQTNDRVVSTLLKFDVVIDDRCMETRLQREVKKLTTRTGQKCSVSVKGEAYGVGFKRVHMNMGHLRLERERTQ